MTTTCKDIKKIKVNKNLDDNLKKIISSPVIMSPFKLAIPIKEMKLSKDYRRIAKEITDCGGYSGHCGCLNNACMMCTSFH